MDSPHSRDDLRIAPTSRIYPNVRLGRNVVVEDYCILGYPPQGFGAGDLQTVVGDETLIRSHSVIYAGSEIGAHCHISHAVIVREHTCIGERCSIGANVIVEHHCRIGDRVRVQGQAGLCEHTVVEDDAWIGPRVVTTNVLHPRCERAKECLNGPIIRRAAIIGANVCLAPDIEVGENAFVSAGSVVAKSVPDSAIFFGNPARKISNVNEVTCKYDIVAGSPYAAETPARRRSKIPLVDLAAQHQEHKQAIRLAIDRVIYNARFINGKEVAEFEQAFGSFCGVNHVVGVANGTDALTLALRAVEVGAGDEVLIPSHTFMATASAVLAVGATPVFVEIDERTYTLNVKDVIQKINGKTKAIVPVHLYGHPADMRRIMEIAAAHRLKVVEDAAQAHGAKIDGRSCGQWGDVTAFSFYPGKNLGAYGDAGCIATNDSALAERLYRLRNHGRSSKYLSEIVGGNHRLDTIQAAVLGVKLKHLAKWNQARVRWADLYRQGLKDLPITLPWQEPNYEHVYHLFVICTPERDRLREYLASEGIEAGVHYPTPCHLQPALSYLGYRRGDLPVTEKAADQVLSLPLYPELGEERLAYVVDRVQSFFRGA